MCYNLYKTSNSGYFPINFSDLSFCHISDFFFFFPILPLIALRQSSFSNHFSHIFLFFFFLTLQLLFFQLFLSFFFFGSSSLYYSISYHYIFFNPSSLFFTLLLLIIFPISSYRYSSHNPFPPFLPLLLLIISYLIVTIPPTFPLLFHSIMFAYKKKR